MTRAYQLYCPEHGRFWGDTRHDRCPCGFQLYPASWLQRAWERIPWRVKLSAGVFVAFAALFAAMIAVTVYELQVEQMRARPYELAREVPYFPKKERKGE